MADSLSITTALGFHSSIAAMAGCVTSDDMVDAFTTAGVEALDAALRIPATSFSDVRAKLQAVMAEAGGGLVEVEDLAFIASDLELLLGRLQ